ncbi:Phosphatidylinositol 4-kinase stt4 Short=PI4-kinase; Short=PtdIns-4-kinase [Serendipita indica DSM 11827]|nr:Phosphatidylinositol 4-kinase stt4 Short=PI4-kinase; Short=PtdIns-4-kinase [Serendipita indica DSM 11827]
MAQNLPLGHLESAIPVLLDILRDIPFVDFDQSLAWSDWALPDQLVYSTVTALLRLAEKSEGSKQRIVAAIIKLASQIVSQMQGDSLIAIVTQTYPAFHGLYRAIISTSFHWTTAHWLSLSDVISKLLEEEVIDRLNNLLSNVVELDDPNSHLPQTVLARYVGKERPLSGYFAVCCVMEMQWTVLAQTLIQPSDAKEGHCVTVQDIGEDAAAANAAWNVLVSRKVVISEHYSADIVSGLNRAQSRAMECFTDLLAQMGELEGEPSMDTYAWETMAECLKIASVCSAALQTLDSNLHSRLKLLLSDTSPVYDPFVQEAALEATTMLLRNFKSIAPGMIGHLRRFIATPLSIFQIEFASEQQMPLVLLATAKCLALCIQLSPGEDLIMSTMYSLLNYIAASSKTSDGTKPIGTSPYMNDDDPAVNTYVETGLRSFTEEEKRLVSISTVCVVSTLALEFKVEEVTRLTVSMLLQYLRTAEVSVESAIAWNLVPLALVAPQPSFVDIIRAFCNINRAEANRSLNSMVLAAQTRLAQSIKLRSAFYDVYLAEILTLFADKGIAIQTASGSHPDKVEAAQMEELCSLLLPLDALLSHADFHPHVNALPTLVTKFRNLWLLCVLFGFTSTHNKPPCMNEWHVHALMRIAEKTPPIVLEDAHEFMSAELEYNPVLRQDYLLGVLQQHRTTLASYIPLKQAEIRYLLPAHVIFLLSFHDLESIRSARGYPSSMPTYFLNKDVNMRENLISCMDSVAEKIMRSSISELSSQIVEHSLPVSMSEEMQKLLVAACHRINKVRDVAAKYLHRLITSFPSLMCDAPLVCAILEVLTLLRRACEGEFTDEYNPQHEFKSTRSNILLELTGSYTVRNEILGQLHRNAVNWLSLGINRAPVEVQATLQKYLAHYETVLLPETVEMGASLALQFACKIPPSERKIASTSGPNPWTPDRSKVLASQLSAKERFAGKRVGYASSTMKVKIFHTIKASDSPSTANSLHLLSPPFASLEQLKALHLKLKQTAHEIREKVSDMKLPDFKRLLFRAAAALISSQNVHYELLHELAHLPFVAFSPSSIAVGVEAWTWLIGERPDMEIALMTEIDAGWAETIKRGKGVFSKSMNFKDPFEHPIEYTPTDKASIDRVMYSGQRLLSPHNQLLRMLLSRFQSVRYRRSGLMLVLLRLVLRSTKAHKLFSTNAMAREGRFSFLIFGFEALKSSKMDLYSEIRLRDGLYDTAFSWFATRPQWTFGASRVQLDADIKVLNEFMESLQSDIVRGSTIVTSYDGRRSAEGKFGSDYLTRLKTHNLLLRLLVENEIYRLTVWGNPSNEPKRGMDHLSSVERGISEATWVKVVQTAWEVNPAVAVQMAERFKPAQGEVTRLIKAHPERVLHVPEALQYLLGNRLDHNVRKSLKILHLWDPVPPVVAVTYFSPAYGNDSIILQYAHRVLEQHPVELTFFFVPQVVQALRYDALGYVERFIFETAKISQLFCHQIIWNMQANCYKDDAGEIEDAMKPMLDRMTGMMVQSLSGEAREFYDREFGFFKEVTSISGKLKPYIRREKSEKKAKIDEEMAKIKVEVGVYLPSNPDGKVVDIDKKSGRPLQSHAKAPFMATFKVRKERVEINTDPNAVVDTSAEGEGGVRTEYDTWVQAIFKVGDDCRQDVLALQVIAMFKNSFTAVGLTLYLMPYRVIATGPGMGVIDVVPNATSRDEMGRAKINDLLAFFVARFGSEDTVAFQKARLNFIQSMAAYSVACYILQIKDRHNGNIMIDGELTCCKGVKFEPNSFKLNKEMVTVMGGRNSEGFALFTRLTIKAFLAVRPHAEQIIDTIQLMLGSGLPSFKGDPTIRRLRDRFALHLNERGAADWMASIVRNAYENMRSTLYDEFQRLQNAMRAIMLQRSAHSPQKSYVSEAITEVARQLGGPTSTQVAYDAFITLVYHRTLVSMVVQLSWRVMHPVIIPINNPAAKYEQIVATAKSLCIATELCHISRERICLAIPATWDGIEAARELKARFGIRSCMRFVYTTTQAVACGVAGLEWIAPPVSAIKKWHDLHDDSPFYDSEQLECHPGIIFVKRMAEIFHTRKFNTRIMPEGIETGVEATALAGISHICLPTSLVEVLEATSGTVNNELDQVRVMSLARIYSPDFYANRENFELAMRQEELTEQGNLLQELLQQSVRDDMGLRALIEREVAADEEFKKIEHMVYR